MEKIMSATSTKKAIKEAKKLAKTAVTTVKASMAKEGGNLNGIMEGKFCKECFGRHPNHKSHCSYEKDSIASSLNVVSLDYKNDKDIPMKTNGGYAGLLRHNADPWAYFKMKPDDFSTVEEADKEIDGFVDVEGDWVEV